ncbi:hypothetical protein [Vibrio diabolicus]|uniref:hypothetical protein n=1 Tax=Vibrio diabolicus TaxID=50719 RepID=UPI0034A0CBCE
MHYDRLELPTEQIVTIQQVLTKVALLEIGALTELEANGRVLKYARALENYDVKKAPNGAFLIRIRAFMPLNQA